MKLSHKALFAPVRLSGACARRAGPASEEGATPAFVGKRPPTGSSPGAPPLSVGGSLLANPVGPFPSPGTAGLPQALALNPNSAPTVGGRISREPLKPSIRQQAASNRQTKPFPDYTCNSATERFSLKTMFLIENRNEGPCASGPSSGLIGPGCARFGLRTRSVQRPGLHSRSPAVQKEGFGPPDGSVQAMAESAT
jgi:hypothetical protein